MRVVDLFAGAGGFSEGARLAGAEVVWASNHNPVAVEYHRANHPGTIHVCQDLHQADFTQLPPYDLLLASPACQGHSPASQPQRLAKHDADRSTAWAVVSCLDATMPRAVIVENVPAFRRWRLYRVWRSAIEELGYHVQEIELCAADHGAPQNRRRLFVYASRAGARIRPVGSPGATARSFMDLAEGGKGWAPVADKPDGVRLRVSRARPRFGRDPFLVHYSRDHRGRSLDRPIATVTTKHQWALCIGDQIRMLRAPEYQAAMGFRASYRVPAAVTKAVKLLGNAVPPPLACAVVRASMDAEI